MDTNIRVAQIVGMTDIAKLLGFFQKIAEEQGWKPDIQLEACLDRSVHFGLWDGDVLVGGLQLVVAAQTFGLPYLTVWPELKTDDPAVVADIAVLAVDKEYRRNWYFWMLCIEAWRYCRKHGIARMWMEVPIQNLRLYRRLGWPMQIMGPERMHWNELCYPCRIETTAAEGAVVTLAEHSPRYRQLVEQAYRQD